MTMEQLDHLRTMRIEICRYDELVERLRSRAERLTSILTGMPTGTRDYDELAEIIAQIVDNEQYAAQKVIEFMKARKEVEDWLGKLPEQQGMAMRLYYTDGVETWQKVAERLSYSYRHMRRIKDAASKKLEDVPQCPIKP